MKGSRSRASLAAAAAIWAAWMLFLTPAPTSATLDMQKEAKAKGFPAANCQYCHVEKLPKAGAVTNNERGKWLVDEKTKRNADKVDVAWLKDYPGDKK
jgi:hypothetical protein